MPVEHDLQFQARLPAALVTIHNFILEHEPIDDQTSEANVVIDAVQILNDAYDTQEEVLDELDASTAAVRRDEIAQRMWEQYQQVLAQQLIDGGNDEEEDEELGEIEDDMEIDG